jgi:hypothetical protein
MTILNLATDGLHSQVIVLAAVLAKHGPMKRDDLISVCAVRGDDGAGDHQRLRAALARWLELGLFAEGTEEGIVLLRMEHKRSAPLDQLTDRLPAVCRRLILQDQHCLPLWGSGDNPTEKGVGRVSDFARGLAWALAQDIYTLGETATDIEALETPQVTKPRTVFQNGTRWPGLRAWARYLGFGTGHGGDFLFDPTEAVRGELAGIFDEGGVMAAANFLDELGARLPVLDGGTYRKEVEANLRPDTWRKPEPAHLSMSLSMALRRLELNGTIVLDRKADAGHAVSLTGRNYRSWATFTHVRMAGDQA